MRPPDLENKASGRFLGNQNRRGCRILTRSNDATIGSMVTDSSDDPNKQERHRRYEKPTPMQLTKEEAKRKLIETARRGGPRSEGNVGNDVSGRRTETILRQEEISVGAISYRSPESSVTFVCHGVARLCHASSSLESSYFCPG